MAGSLVRADGRVLTVSASGPLLPGTPVRVDVDGGLVLGEVVGSEIGTSRSYLSIKIDQVIPSLSDLAALVRNIMEVPARDAPGEESTPRSRARAAAG